MLYVAWMSYQVTNFHTVVLKLFLLVPAGIRKIEGFSSPAQHTELIWSEITRAHFLALICSWNFLSIKPTPRRRSELYAVIPLRRATYILYFE